MKKLIVVLALVCAGCAHDLLPVSPVYHDRLVEAKAKAQKKEDRKKLMRTIGREIWMSAFVGIAISHQMNDQ